ncbi:unnamed protein product [Protopolystoma xenopodis]|uniref:Uncharacterized protein n=1 Tax=Protopolystoma xenopodis TaxID=117903 RepID=A0A3S5AE13_9PLAT|nr:unnamed protein product [Protopolystoma xenopodis]
MSTLRDDEQPVVEPTRLEADSPALSNLRCHATSHPPTCRGGELGLSCLAGPSALEADRGVERNQRSLEGGHVLSRPRRHFSLHHPRLCPGRRITAPLPSPTHTSS